MKKTLLFAFLLCSTAFSYAQLTTPTFPNKVFNMTTPPNGTTPASFSSTTGAPFVYINKYAPNGQIMNKWQIVTLPHQNSFPTIWAESSYNTSLLPPCNDFWSQGGGYIQIIFSGTDCIQLPIGTVGSTSVTTTVNGIVYPVFTSNQIQTIPNPTVGLTVFDFSKGYLRTWNGTIWSPL